MIGLFDGLKIGAGALIGIALASTPIYLSGKRAGRSEAAQEAIQSSLDALRSRSATDAEISLTDAAGMCRHLGLLEDDERECVRRLEQAANDATNGAAHHNE